MEALQHKLTHGNFLDFPLAFNYGGAADIDKKNNNSKNNNSNISLSEDGLHVSENEYWEKYYEHPDFNYEWNNGALEEKPMAD